VASAPPATVVSPRAALAILMGLEVLTPLLVWLSPVGRVRHLAELSTAKTDG
jgi:hypothetical protein